MRDSIMQSLPVLIAALSLAPCVATGQPAVAQPAAGALRQAYARVDDIRIYYELRGEGRPIILLHGGFGSTELWTPCAERLAARHLVVVPDARGRGRTSDGAGPISAGRTARDLVGLMDHLGLDKADIVGHSAGSLTAIHMLVDYPERVGSATLVGSPFIALAQPNEALRKLRRDIEALRDGKPVSDADLLQFADRWRRSSPDPSRFPYVMDKLSRSVSTAYSESVLSTLSRPVLVVRAGRDALIPAEAFDRLAAVIPGSQLIDFPQGTHGLPRQEAARLADAILQFVDSRKSPEN